MSKFRWRVLDRLIITAIAAVVIWGGTWVALNTTWFKAPRRGTPVGEMTPEEARRLPAASTRTITAGPVSPAEWGLMDASFTVGTRETIAVVDLEIRTGSGRVVARESATTFADGGRTLISFPVLTQAQDISISARYTMEEPGDETVRCAMRYFKLGRSPALLQHVNGVWVKGTGPAPDGRRRDPATGTYAHALPAADFRERQLELPFETTYGVTSSATPPTSLRAARKNSGVFDGPAVWLRGADAWLLESKDGKTHVVGKAGTEVLPGRLVALVDHLRRLETSRRHPSYAAEVRTGDLRITADTLLESARRLDAEGREFDGLAIRRR